MISKISLGRWCINRLRELIRLNKSLRKSDSADCTVLLIACPAASGDISADDTLNWKHLKLLAHHTFAFELLLLEEFRHVLGIDGNHMVRYNILCIVKPEFGHLGQYSAFVGNFVL